MLGISPDFHHLLARAQVAAESMQARQASKGDHIEWQVADMLCLPHRSGSQDVVIEKGALDVFLVDRGSPWDPTPQAAARMRTALSQIHRCSPPTPLEWV